MFYDLGLWSLHFYLFFFFLGTYVCWACYKNNNNNNNNDNSRNNTNDINNNNNNSPSSTTSSYSPIIIIIIIITWAFSNKLTNSDSKSMANCSSTFLSTVGVVGVVTAAKGDSGVTGARYQEILRALPLKVFPLLYA